LSPELSLHAHGRLALLQQQARGGVAQAVRRKVWREAATFSVFRITFRTRLSSGSVPASVQKTDSGIFDQPRF
jgi:hypothetical protein